MGNPLENSLWPKTCRGIPRILFDLRRTSTVTAKTKAELLIVQKQDYDRLRISHGKESEGKIELLTRVEAFKSWPRTDLVQLADATTVERFTPNRGSRSASLTISYCEPRIIANGSVYCQEGKSESVERTVDQ